MSLQKGVQQVFVQLSDSLSRLSSEEYIRPIEILFNASIGQHVRHIAELYICLLCGYETNIVNYEKRERDIKIETDRDFAVELLKKIYKDLNRENKILLMEASYDEDSSEGIQITTNYYREIAYNLEHTVHHMALIRVGINNIASIDLPESYGIAAATVKKKKKVNQ